MAIKALIIDDDEKLSRLLAERLAHYGVTLLSATLPDQGLALIASEKPDIVILDVMMPGRDGFDVCREIRQTSQVPVLMLTARGDVTDRVVGLEIGADDYVQKPVDPRELLARINALLRRVRAPEASRSVLEFGSLVIDFDQKAAFLDGEDVKLSTMEFEVLALFSKHPRKVLSRDDVLDKLRGIEWETFNRSIDVLISRLRQKLKDDPKHPRFFKTVWGSGYLFLGDGDPQRKAS